MSFDAVLAHVGAPRHGGGGHHHHGHHGGRFGRRGFGFFGPAAYEIVVPWCSVEDLDELGRCPPPADIVGAVERRNPLPVGRYWVDVFTEKDGTAFEQWIADSHGAVKIRTLEHHEDETPVRDWVLFDVLQPFEWRGPGLPTIADTSVTTSSDTAQRPPPVPSVATQVEQMVESASSSVSSIGAIGKGLLIVAGSGVALALVLSVARGRR